MNITRATTILTGEFQAFYSSLGVFRPARAPKFIPYAERIAYTEEGRAKHRATVRRNPLKWVRSALREIGESLVGAFLVLED